MLSNGLTTWDGLKFEETWDKFFKMEVVWGFDHLRGHNELVWVLEELWYQNKSWEILYNSLSMLLWFCLLNKWFVNAKVKLFIPYRPLTLISFIDWLSSIWGCFLTYLDACFFYIFLLVWQWVYRYCIHWVAIFDIFFLIDLLLLI